MTAASSGDGTKGDPPTPSLEEPILLADDPLLDGTDFAHPAWWRGHEHTTHVFCQKVNEILDGKDDGRGTANQPWEGLRRRLLALVEKARQSGG